MLKPGIFACIILGYVGLASILFLKKFNSVVTPLDEIKTALGSLRGTLNPLSTIGCRSYTQKDETTNQVANAMVPVSVVPFTVTRDTMLYVFNIDAPDSLIHATTSNQGRLWELKSEHYYFLLISNKDK